MALTDQHFRVSRTLIREDAQADKFEADFYIEEKPPAQFTLDDLIAGLNNLKSIQGIPGTARIGSPVTFSLRW